MLKSYGDPAARLTNKLRYLVDKKRFDELLSQFGNHRQSISLILELIQGNSQKEQTAKVEGIIEQQKKAQEELRKNQEEISRLIKDSIASLQANEQANTDRILSGLQAGLQSKGMNAEEAKTCKNAIWEEASQKAAKGPFSYAKLPTFSYAPVAGGQTPPDTTTGEGTHGNGSYQRNLGTAFTKAQFASSQHPNSTSSPSTSIPKPNPRYQTTRPGSLISKMPPRNPTSNLPTSGGTQQTTSPFGTSPNTSTKVPSPSNTRNGAAQRTPSPFGTTSNVFAKVSPNLPTTNGTNFPPVSQGNTQLPPKDTSPTFERAPSFSGISEDYRILCVDEKNGGKTRHRNQKTYQLTLTDVSQLTQAFLEIMRMRLAHGTGQWVFKRIDSAGYERLQSRSPNSWTAPQVITPSFQRGMSGVKPERYPWALDYPNEVSRIKDRRTNQPTSWLQAVDFNSYNLILCFSASDANTIGNLKRDIVPGNPETNFQRRIRHVPGCERFLGVDCQDTKTRDELVAAVGEMVDKFTEAEYGEWYNKVKAPSDMRYRTLQFEMQETDLPSTSRDPVPLNEIPKVKEWEKASGCSIKITRNRAPSNGTSEEMCTVSVIGPKGSNIVTIFGTKCLLARVEDTFRGIATAPLQLS